MGRVLLALERYHRDVLARQGSHPLCGPAALSVGTIRGGTSVNVIPHACTIEIDRRLRPDEQPRQAWRDALEFLQTELETSDPLLRFDPPLMEAPALSDRDNRALADRLAGIVRDVVGECRLTGVAYATDAPFFSSLGIPTVVFGPGSLAQAHTDEEWISLDQLEQAAEVFYRAGREWL
jgi:acetylornithine deacetylase